ncbi:MULTISPECIES: 8-oxo-dGTP diphosphatase [Erysipelotrichales]|uniref:8-oxo-dGTP diphosphatase n=1 Tax=Longibaculum muris TaxID=1796628 RepID=A0A4R3Z4Y0_9FIRM|nr:8-oxo-dGTP diphosphatase [Longibaculum muris]MCR1887825.1 8-oxo-dGTP diphosphatase [Longibaculum muris]TCW01269.1 8-oxo-dGTP diphosphatase [Longibaculum muris]
MNRKTPVELTNMCMIYDDQGNVLVEEKLVHNSKGLIFPGGHVESNESVAESMIREIKEETGLTISNLQFCGIKDWIELDGSRYMVFLYKTSTYSGSIQSSSEGEIFWMPLKELKAKETLWHLDMMLEIFEGNGVTELYFNRNLNTPNPELK